MPERMYIGNLPYKTTENDLRTLFEKYEPIHSLILIADKATEQPRGYGFIELDEPKADIALSDLKNATFNGRSLRFSKATGKNPRQKQQKINTERKIMAARIHKIARRNTTTTEFVVLKNDNYG